MSAPTPQHPVRPTVLLVDDEPRLRDVMRLGLGQQFEVEEAASVHEAEMMLATKHYDVIVCDHLMPGEEGLPFLMRARVRFPKTQRILLTGYVNAELLSRSTELGGLAGCLMKPVSAVELTAAIRFAIQ